MKSHRAPGFWRAWSAPPRKGGGFSLGRLLQFAALAALVLVGVNRVSAQTGNAGKSMGGPKPMARMLERGRLKLDVKDDQEWKIIQERLERVLRAQRDYQNGLFTAKSRASNAGAKKADRGGPPSESGNANRPAGTADSDAGTLRKLVESKAESGEIKTALARLRGSLRQQQDELERAQEDLRSVLTPRQEAIAVLSGWLR